MRPPGETELRDDILRPRYGQAVDMGRSRPWRRQSPSFPARLLLTMRTALAY